MLQALGAAAEYTRINAAFGILLHEVDDLTKKQELWQQMSASTSPVEYTSYGRDIVKQLLVGLGFRVTRCSKLSSETRSLVVTSKDPRGIQFIVTAPVRKGSSYWESPCGLFTQGKWSCVHCV